MNRFTRNFLFRQIDRYNDRDAEPPFWLRYFMRRDSQLQQYSNDLKNLESLLTFQLDEYRTSRSESESSEIKSSVASEKTDGDVRVWKPWETTASETKRRDKRFRHSPRWATLAVSIAFLSGIAVFFQPKPTPKPDRQLALLLDRTFERTQRPIKIDFRKFSTNELKEYFPLCLIAPIETTLFIMADETPADLPNESPTNDLTNSNVSSDVVSNSVDPNDGDSVSAFDSISVVDSSNEKISEHSVEKEQSFYSNLWDRVASDSANYWKQFCRGTDR